MRRPDTPQVYAVVDQWREVALLNDDSLFTPGRTVWAAPRIEELYHHFNEAPDESSDSFETKFKRQLQDVAPLTVQLAAEMLYMMTLIVMDMKSSSKRALVEKVLSWSPDKIDIPLDLVEALDHGLVAGGLSFTVLRPFQLWFMVEFAKKWKGLTAQQQAEALRDPWSFRALLYDTPVEKGYAMRETLLHLVFPEEFEDIIAKEHKKAIAKGFDDLVGDPSADIDHKLLAIRHRLAVERPGWFSFYDADLHARWQTTKGERERWDEFIGWGKRYVEVVDLDTEERAYKLKIAERLGEARQAMSNEDPAWIEKLASAFREDNNLVHHITASRFLEWAGSHGDAARDLLMNIWRAEVDLFDQLPPLAVLATELDTNFLTLGSFLMMANDVTRFPPMQATPLSKAYELTATAEWGTVGVRETRRYHRAWTFFQRVVDEAAERGLSLRDRLDAQCLVWAVTRNTPPDAWDQATKQDFLRWRGDIETVPADMAPPGPNEEPVALAPADLGALAASLYMPEEFLQEAIDLLRERKQIILYGPPGTGKTFIARALAAYLAGSRYEIVQFHPSYSYEDFVWGYRPTTSAGSISYELTPGPLKRIADRAQGAQGEHILIIDEINRGNLPKILGELLYLLEYRSDPVQLMYSNSDSGDFTLPANLLIIGTMNTADRSVGLIDAALRRRFHFIPLFPGEDPITDTLRSWLVANRPDMAHVADIVDALNGKLVPRLGKHLQLGHSYFFRDDLDDEILTKIWKYDVMPFIQDQLFGHEDELAEFSLAKILEELDENNLAEGMDPADRTPDA